MKNRFMDCRKATGLTMREAGARLGIAESTVSLYETGKHDPDVDMIKRMAQLYGVSVGYLMGETEKEPQAQGKRLDSALVNLLVQLDDAQAQRVRDFVAGMIASRKG